VKTHLFLGRRDGGCYHCGERAPVGLCAASRWRWPGVLGVVFYIVIHVLWVSAHIYLVHR
jgi:hypothetical protein